MKAVTPLFRYADGWWYHSLAIIYACGAYGLGLAGLFSSSLWLNMAAVVLLAHGMVIAAYMVHEAGHHTVFKKPRYNNWLGMTMTWLCGAAYHKFEDIRFKHFRHHIENDDIVWFDYEKFFLEHKVIYQITRALEWLYIPAHELIMHSITVVNAFVIPQRRQQRLYNATVIIVRAGLFVTLLWFSLAAAIMYCIAYLLMLIVLRFMDSLQHDYDYTLTLFSPQRSLHRGDREWEQAHTFSVPLSLNYPLVNWLTLNFGYHNAHHAQMEQPWYRLPALHREMFGDQPESVIPFVQQLKIYHRGRVVRLVKWDDTAPNELTPEGSNFLKAAQQAQVYGGNAASFLTAI